MSGVTFVLWWIVIPISIGVLAQSYSSRRKGVLAWSGIIVASAGGLALNSALQTYDICGITIAEMLENPTRNCIYASNSINETYWAHFVVATIASGMTFLITTILRLLSKWGTP